MRITWVDKVLKVEILGHLLQQLRVLSKKTLIMSQCLSQSTHVAESSSYLEAHCWTDGSINSEMRPERFGDARRRHVGWW